MLEYMHQCFGVERFIVETWLDLKHEAFNGKIDGGSLLGNKVGRKLLGFNLVFCPSIRVVPYYL
jgi:hypothetical protein